MAKNHNFETMPLFILKIGGSVVTQKNRFGSSIRKKLIKKIAHSIKETMGKQKFQLILIHGAGAGGHQLAEKYGLKKGTGKNKRKWFGSFLSRVANQKLNTTIAEIFLTEGLPIVSTHTASIIIQKNGKIADCNLKIIKETLQNNCIPLLYGEMVFDKKLGMSICSGDAIVPYLAKKLKARKIFFASDVDGIFTNNPNIYKNTKLVEEIVWNEIKKKVKLSGSHNIDVTGGLLGKIEKLEILKNTSIQSIEIFNGLAAENYSKILSGKLFSHTNVKI